MKVENVIFALTLIGVTHSSLVAASPLPGTQFRGPFLATGLSYTLNPSEAEFNMLEQANNKCFVVAGPERISETVFTTYRGVLYASAKFDCVGGALDGRKCAYPDDTNPDCDERLGKR